MRTQDQRQVRPTIIFNYAILIGLVAGIIMSTEPNSISRWRDYQRIDLGMKRDEAVQLIESSGESLTGCGSFHSENKDQVCRFEDPWRGYLINFDPNTKLVDRKHFYFKRTPWMR